MRPDTRITLVAFAAIGFCLAGARPMLAQVPDHIECYKIKDPQAKASYTADLGGLVAEPGCKITVPAVVACVPTTKTNVTPPPPGGGGTGTPDSFFCYKVKCPKATLPALAGTDQFGSRTVTPKTSQLLCAPLAGSPTTTTTSSTTSTTLRFVDNGDGTVTDRQTGLQWEQKTNGTKDNQTNWSTTGSAPDGGIFFTFLPGLNGGVTGVGNCVSPDGSTITGGFNNHCDWRLPTIAELRTIRLTPCGVPHCIDPVFGPTPTTGAPLYWSATSTPGSPSFSAWFFDFDGGVTSPDTKGANHFYRAVRGGS